MKAHLNIMNYFLKDELATRAFGEFLFGAIKKQNFTDFTIYLEGNLGAGKTTLVRGFLQAWGYLDHIKSPTFALVEPYEAPHGKVFHFDLYRLKSPQELEMMGVRDYFEQEAVRIIEWPDKAEGLLPKPDILIKLDFHGEQRQINLEDFSKKGEIIKNTLCD